MNMKFRRLKNELAAIWFIAAKDIKIYYSKPPVLMFGIMFPVFMFLSFLVKRQISPAEAFGSLSSMTLFFMASSIGPVVIPLEKRQHFSFSREYLAYLKKDVNIGIKIYGTRYS